LRKEREKGEKIRLESKEPVGGRAASIWSREISLVKEEIVDTVMM